VARSVADGFRVFEQNLQGQSLATSGVSLDEEAVKMIQFQRSYQVSAKYIATLSELLDLLVKL
jgi:flagellar hook-associated protein 1 FlgK